MFFSLAHEGPMYLSWVSLADPVPLARAAMCSWLRLVFLSKGVSVTLGGLWPTLGCAYVELRLLKYLDGVGRPVYTYTERCIVRREKETLGCLVCSKNGHNSGEVGNQYQHKFDKKFFKK